jgi:DNA/RNA endonuclease YhcR with UshA esterase domain
MSEVAPSTKAHCPSCGRFVGPYETCPYCGARLRGRIPVRAVKLAAIVLAIVGLLALWFAARHIDIPTVSAADAMGSMNMAYVKVSGRVVRSLTYDPESDYLGFWVDDGTGEVRVTAYRDVTQALLDAGTMPALGDEVTVAGTLRIREDYVSLTLNVPDHLDLRRPEPVTLGTGELTPLDEGLRVQVAGEVTRVYAPYEGLTLITVRDETGEVPVAVDELVETLTGELPEIVEGQGIAVVGAVTLYKDTPQIVPASVDDLALAEAPPAATVDEVARLSALSAEDEGSVVQVAGRVVRMEGFKGGVKAILDDGTAQVTLLLWDSVYSALEAPQSLDVGAELVVTGEVQVYRGELEVVPEDVADLVIETPAPTTPWEEVGLLRATDVGRVVRLRGVLGEPEGFSAGVKVPLDDGTGTITVLLWTNIYQAISPAPQAGMTVEVVGEVEEYQGELEIIPRSAQDWRVGE